MIPTHGKTQNILQDEQSQAFNSAIKSEMHSKSAHIEEENISIKDKINKKVEALGHAMKTAAESHLEKRDIKVPDTSRSPELEALFKERERELQRQ